MSKRPSCNHLQVCQICQDALDDAVDAMLEGVLGPAEDGEEEVSEGDGLDSEEEEDSRGRNRSRSRSRKSRASLDTQTTSPQTSP